MFQKVTTLTEFIIEEQRKFPQAQGNFTLLMTQIENATKIIASHVKKTGLVDIIGATGETNVHKEQVQKLDIFSNELLVDTLVQSGEVCMIASEEMEHEIHVEKNSGEYTVFFDPLDGSSNIDVNVSIGTIFSIYRKSEHILQKGREQVAAGYIVYGPSVMFVYTSGHGVNGFTLDPSIGSFLLSHPNIQIPETGEFYSINEAYYDLFDSRLQTYLRAIKVGEKPRALRYVGSMVADVHRTLLKGGIFANPANIKKPNGKLRLMYEVNPLSFIIEQAGGMSYSRSSSPLDIAPSSLHETVPIVLGSRRDVEEYVRQTLQ